MSRSKQELGLILSADNESGEIQAVYFQVRIGKVAEVEEKITGKVFVNYDKDGKLLGVEMLAPCEISVFELMDIPKAERDRRLAEFRLSAKEYVEKALAKSEGRKPSKAKVKHAVDQLMKYFGPVV